MDLHPRLSTHGPRAGARAVVLLLHGGRAHSTEPAPRGLAYLRMTPFAWALRRTAGADVAVAQLSYRYRGWNEPHQHPLQDARWALDRLGDDHPGAPIVLVGHSMGGRVALRFAGAEPVAGVCALAPWLESNEPAHLPRDRPVRIAHGDRDRVTDPRRSARYAAAVGAHYIRVRGDGHAMLGRPGIWTALVTDFVTTTLRVRRGSH